MGDVALIVLLWSIGDGSERVSLGIVDGIHEFDDLPISPRARNLLATRARGVYQPMAPERVWELARLEPDGGLAAVSAPEAVARMAEFEQQFGGLWYSILRDRENGMEYGLEGSCTVFRTGFGAAFRGIVDGAWTWPVDILHDGRTPMRLGGCLGQCDRLQRHPADRRPCLAQRGQALAASQVQPRCAGRHRADGQCRGIPAAGAGGHRANKPLVVRRRPRGPAAP
jgi:hypothetical protein